MPILRPLGITGTLNFFIGNTLVPRFVKSGQLAAIIAKARNTAGEPDVFLKGDQPPQALAERISTHIQKDDRSE